MVPSMRAWVGGRIPAAGDHRASARRIGCKGQPSVRVANPRNPSRKSRRRGEGEVRGWMVVPPFRRVRDPPPWRCPPRNAPPRGHPPPSDLGWPPPLLPPLPPKNREGRPNEKPGTRRKGDGPGITQGGWDGSIPRSLPFRPVSLPLPSRKVLLCDSGPPQARDPLEIGENRHSCACTDEEEPRGTGSLVGSGRG